MGCPNINCCKKLQENDKGDYIFPLSRNLSNSNLKSNKDLIDATFKNTTFLSNSPLKNNYGSFYKTDVSTKRFNFNGFNSEFMALFKLINEIPEGDLYVFNKEINVYKNGVLDKMCISDCNARLSYKILENVWGKMYVNNIKSNNISNNNNSNNSNNDNNSFNTNHYNNSTAKTSSVLSPFLSLLFNSSVFYFDKNDLNNIGILLSSLIKESRKVNKECFIFCYNKADQIFIIKGVEEDTVLLEGNIDNEIMNENELIMSTAMSNKLNKNSGSNSSYNIFSFPLSLFQCDFCSKILLISPNFGYKIHVLKGVFPDKNKFVFDNSIKQYVIFELIGEKWEALIIERGLTIVEKSIKLIKIEEGQTERDIDFITTYEGNSYCTENACISSVLKPGKYMIIIENLEDKYGNNGIEYTLRISAEKSYMDFEVQDNENIVNKYIFYPEIGDNYLIANICLNIYEEIFSCQNSLTPIYLTSAKNNLMIKCIDSESKTCFIILKINERYYVKFNTNNDCLTESEDDLMQNADIIIGKNNGENNYNGVKREEDIYKFNLIYVSPVIKSVLFPLIPSGTYSFLEQLITDKTGETVSSSYVTNKYTIKSRASSIVSMAYNLNNFNTNFDSTFCDIVFLIPNSLVTYVDILGENCLLIANDLYKKYPETDFRFGLVLYGNKGRNQSKIFDLTSNIRVFKSNLLRTNNSSDIEENSTVKHHSSHWLYAYSNLLSLSWSQGHRIVFHITNEGQDSLLNLRTATSAEEENQDNKLFKEVMTELVKIDIKIIAFSIGNNAEKAFKQLKSSYVKLGGLYYHRCQLNENVDENVKDKKFNRFIINSVVNIIENKVEK